MRKVSICVIILLVVAIQTFAAEPKKGTLRMSGDNTWEAYIDGEKVGQGADWQAVGVYEFDIVNGSFVAAIHVHDAEPGAAGVGGFLGDIVLDNDEYFATGDVGKDGKQTWKCSDDDSYLKNDDWVEPQFNDDDWMEPTLYEQFGGGVWGGGAAAMKNGGLQDPDCEAFWCWAGPNNTADEVFFRYTYGENLAVEPVSKSATTWGMLKSKF